MHVLITGGAGFIGSHVAQKYVHEKHKVTIVDSLDMGFEENIPSRAHFIREDITNEGWTRHLPDDITHVIHLAAQSSGEISFEDPMYDVKTNTVATLELLRWSLDQGVEKFVFASSMSVYGNVEDEPIGENHKINPYSFYGVGKVAGENYIRIFSELGLNSVVLRLFNVYGPGQNMNNMRQGMLSIYLAYIAKGLPITVKGSTERYRDFVYIEDVVNAICLSVQSSLSFDVFNVCTGVKTTVAEALDIIVRKSGFNDYPISIADGTPRDQFGIFGSYKKIQNLLGWVPKYNLESGLNETISWIRDKNPHS
jgi:UDP-glucose 4-epimerase